MLSGLERDASEVAIRVERKHDFPDLRDYYALSQRKKVLLRLKGIDIDAPPPFVLLLQTSS